MKFLTKIFCFLTILSVKAKLDDLEILDDFGSTPLGDHPRKSAKNSQKDDDFWSDTKLETVYNVVRLTDELFDTEIDKKQWLIFFVFDRHNEKYEATLKYVYTLLKALDVSPIQVAFVDVLDADGELLKETFDIERQPACVFVKDQLVYYMPPGPQNTLTWTAADVADFIDVNHKREKQNYLRPRVRKGLPLLFEYVSEYVAQNYFEDVMPQFLHAKRLIETVTGFKLDMKEYNKEWGKKSRSKKSQIRTLLWVLFWPAVICLTLGTVLLTTLMLCCYWRCFPAQKQKRD